MIRATRRYIASILFCCVSLSCGRATAADPAITPSPETTLVTGPLDAEGFVDFVAVVNREWSEGVTPENNSAVQIWLALGAHRLPEVHREEFFRLLGITPSSTVGRALVPWNEFIAESVADGAVFAERLRDVRWQYRRRPWRSAESPILAEWIDRNEAALICLHEASRRERFYTPAVREVEVPLLGECELYTEQQLRDLGGVLACRAALRFGEGDIDGAIGDLAAIRRLAKLLCQGWSLLHVPLSCAMDNYALLMVPSVLQAGVLDDDQLLRLQAALVAFDYNPSLSRVLRGDQFRWIDLLQWAARGVRHDGAPIPPVQLQAALDKIDLNELLRGFNSAFHGLEERLNADTPFHRNLNLALYFGAQDARQRAQMRPEAVARLGWPSLVGHHGGARIAEDWSEAFDEVALTLDYHATRRDMVPVCFALERYRRANGAYPASLEQLVPRFLDEVPGDRFRIGLDPILYRCHGAEYLLYSVGANGRDNGGEFDSDAAEALRDHPDAPDDVILGTIGFPSVRLPPPPPVREEVDSESN